jgi:DNA-damage-inducible protein D
MTEVMQGGNPFETLRRVDDRGEYWMGRELMPHAGYVDWRNFQRAINDARSAMVQEGYDPSDHFALVSLPKNPDQQERGRGRPANVTDWRLSRTACHFTFINGDPNKPEIAAAQHYFVLQTQRMEAVQQAVPQAMPTLPQALRAWADEVEAREKAELQAAEAKAEAEMLRPPAEAWESLADVGQDYSVREAAYILMRDESIAHLVGPQKLFRWVVDNGMAQRKLNGAYIPYAVHSDRLRLKPQSRPDNDVPGGFKEANAQLRITVKGLEWIQQRMREQSRPELLATIPAQRAPEVIRTPGGVIDMRRYREVSQHR